MSVFFVVIEFATWIYMVKLKFNVQSKAKLYNKLISFSNKSKRKTDFRLFSDNLSFASYMLISIIMATFGVIGFQLTKFRSGN